MRPSPKYLGLGLAVMVCLGVAAPRGVAAESPGGAELRLDLDRLIDASESLAAGNPVISSSLDRARAQLAAVPDEEFSTLAPLMGGEVARLVRVLAAARASLVAEAARSEASGALGPVIRSTVPAFPSAPYPDVGWDFLIQSFSDVPGGDDSGSDGGFCSLATAPSANQQFTFLNLSLVAEGARDVADRICNQFGAIVVGGTNLSLACIITDILFLVERGILDNELLCSGNVQAAEVTGSYNRTDHLHDDLAAAETNLTGRIDGAEARLTSEVDVNEAATRDLDADLVDHDVNLSERADQIDGALDAQSQFLVDFRRLSLRLRIARYLAATKTGGAKPMSAFQLPEAFGGFLEEVRDVAAEAIDNSLARGSQVARAQRLLARGDHFSNRGFYKRAAEKYGRAFRAAVGDAS